VQQSWKRLIKSEEEWSQVLIFGTIVKNLLHEKMSRLQSENNVLRKIYTSLWNMTTGQSLYEELLAKIALGEVDKTIVCNKLDEAALRLKVGIAILEPILEPMTDQYEYHEHIAFAKQCAQRYIEAINEMKSRYAVSLKQVFRLKK
jgi:hypothetical protein